MNLDKLKPHQISKGLQLLKLLEEKGYAYLAGKPRSGKTATALFTAEHTNLEEWIIITKKKAIDGWVKFGAIDLTGSSKEECTIDLGLKHKYYVCNYEYISKLDRQYQGVIIDESHNLGNRGKPTKRYNKINKLVGNSPHIHLSGTQVVETPTSIYYQMNLGVHRPFKERTFYEFHMNWGIPHTIFLAGRQVRNYDKYKPELLEYIKTFTVFMTQEDANIYIKANDKLHWINLEESTIKMLKTLYKDKVVILPNGIELIADNEMKERISLHQIEGGTIKIDGKVYFLGNTEKIDYIKQNLLKGKVGIMCHFIGEQDLLKKHFEKEIKNGQVEIFSSNAHKEGVDLSYLDTYIIYSQDYSGSGFIQRKERIINMEGSNTTTVHHLLVKGGISEQVYKITSRKEDFNNSTYEGLKL